MDIALLKDKFARLGARAVMREPRRLNRFRRKSDEFVIDIARDSRGEYFDFRIPRGEDIDIAVIDLQRAMRHLLLLVRQKGRKDKFLCGHDERHWFVAAAPGRSVSTVLTAMEALKPAIVRDAERRESLGTRERLRRRNAAFVRQGEWFFVPAPLIQVNSIEVRRNEPISRGTGSKPHMCEEVFRRGGETVYVSRKYPAGLTEEQYRALSERDPNAMSWPWQVMTRDAEVYARGRVWHADHKTARLDGWHRVLMNTENEAPAMTHVAFLD